MAKERQFIDRGAPLKGIETAARDSRLPFPYARSLQNVTLRDGRISRRNGFKEFSNVGIVGEQLGRHTATRTTNSNIRPAAGNYNIDRFISPLSYGLIRYSDDYQLITTEDKTIEFILTLGDVEELVINPYERKTKRSFGGSRQSIRPAAGVFVYDQSVFVNTFDVIVGGVVYNNVRKSATSTYDDIWCLTGLAVAYDFNNITVMYDMYDLKNSGYIKNFVLSGPISYVPGRAYHVSIVYNSLDLTMTLYLDGLAVSQLTHSVDYVFCGEQDYINGNSTAIQRDIVILNEFTCRASMATTTKIVKDVGTGEFAATAQTFDSYLGDDTRPEPWASSPPKGTGMQELRVWNVARTSEEILGNIFKAINPTLATLVSYFPLNTESKVYTDQALSDPTDRLCTIHSTSPGRVSVTGMLHNRGISFSDGQYAIVKFGLDDYHYIEPLHTPMQAIFGFNTTASPFTDITPGKDFTIGMQIKTPHTFGQELTSFNGSATLTGTKQDTREAMEAKAFGLTDGASITAAVNAYITDEAGTPVVATEMRWHRAFDMTLWSVEGSIEQDSLDLDNKQDNTRIPAARGLLTPNGKIAFEFFGFDNTGYTREFRVVSVATLQPNTVYDITFRKRTLNEYNSGAGRIEHQGYALEIYIDGNLDVSLTVGLNVAYDINWGTCTSAATTMQAVRDLIIGASHVNDIADKSIETPVSDSAVPSQRNVPQFFKSPWQDQPGFFILGYFRLWYKSLSDAEIKQVVGRSLTQEDSNSLLVNIEAGLSIGDRLKSLAKFPTIWQLGYKGWGVSQSRNGTFDTAGITGWALDDCLGTLPCGLPGTGKPFNVEGNSIKSKGLGLFSSTLEQRYGILAGFGASVFYDEFTQGFFKLVYRPYDGLLNDSDLESIWTTTIVADRTIMVADGNYPRVFDGKSIHTLGFRDWRGGQINLSPGTTGSLTTGKWYGVAIYYYSEVSNIFQPSPQVATIYLQAGKNQIIVDYIFPHPDPRVSHIVVAITAGQTTQALAEVAALYGVPNGFLANKTLTNFTISSVDTANPVYQNPADYTPVPQCSLAASYNGRLWLAGDWTIPDIVYYSDAGNVETFDTLANRIVMEEGNGDRIVALIALFGTLFVFKPNSIWRIDETNTGSFIKTQIASVGPASARAIQVISIPDSGKQAIIFWNNGPYMFDELSFRYIGSSIEGTDLNFDNVDPNSVFVIHDIVCRQVYFMVKTKDNVSGFYDFSYVYNYRFDNFTTAYGVPGFTSAAYDVSKKEIGLNDPFYTVNRLALVGDLNGKIYQLDTVPGYDVFDKYVDCSVVVTSHNITTNAITLDINDNPTNTTITPEPFELSGVWITFVAPDRSKWYATPIFYNSIQNIFYLVKNPTESVDGWTCYLGFTPTYMEFPWDSLNIEYYEKQVHRLVVWTVGTEIWYKIAKTFNSPTSLWTIKSVSDTGDRTHIDLIGIKSEVIKLYLASMDIDFRLDAYGYLVETTKEGVKL